MAQRHDDDDSDERPRRRSRPRDDEDDDAPRARRPMNDDDDDESRPRRRTRRDEEVDYDDEPRPKKQRLPREKLLKIAQWQKFLLWSMLGNILGYIVAIIVPNFVGPMGLVLFIPLILFSLTSSVFVFLLAAEVDGPGLGVVFALLTLAPCIGIIMLVVINQRAIAVLARHRIPVGFMGARLSDI